MLCDGLAVGNEEGDEADEDEDGWVSRGVEREAVGSGADGICCRRFRKLSENKFNRFDVHGCCAALNGTRVSSSCPASSSATSRVAPVTCRAVRNMVCGQVFQTDGFELKETDECTTAHTWKVLHRPGSDHTRRTGTEFERLACD